jgi:hypothetical protein
MNHGSNPAATAKPGGSSQRKAGVAARQQRAARLLAEKAGACARETTRFVEISCGKTAGGDGARPC